MKLAAATVAGDIPICWRHGSKVGRIQLRQPIVIQRRVACKAEKDAKDNTDDLLANLDALLGKPAEPKPPKQEKPTEEAQTVETKDEPAEASTSSTQLTPRQQETLQDLQQDQSTFTYELQEDLEIPKEDIDKLRQNVLAFTFYVTEIDNLAKKGFPGVVFFGNLRKDSVIASQELRDRLAQNFGNKYALYLLKDGDNPYVAVTTSDQALGTAFRNEGFVRGVAITSWVLTFLSALQSTGLPVAVLALSLIADTSEVPLGAIASVAAPGALLFMGYLALHEFGHWQVAKKYGIRTYWPITLPAFAGVLPSFGTLTAFRESPNDREQLLEMSLRGPLYALAASWLGLILGLILTKFGVGTTIQLPSLALADSAVAALSAKLILGNDIAGTTQLAFNPLVPASLAAFVVNALNLLPLGESDGGRMCLSLYGRKVARYFGFGGALLLVALGVFDNPAFLTYIGAVAIILRGPTTPMKNEVKEVPRGLASLAVGLLVGGPMLGLTPVPADFLGLEEPQIDLEQLQTQVQELRELRKQYFEQQQNGGVQLPPQQPAPGLLDRGLGNNSA